MYARDLRIRVRVSVHVCLLSIPYVNDAEDIGVSRVNSSRNFLKIQSYVSTNIDHRSKGSSKKKRANKWSKSRIRRFIDESFSTTGHSNFFLSASRNFTRIHTGTQNFFRNLPSFLSFKIQTTSRLEKSFRWDRQFLPGAKIHEFFHGDGRCPPKLN